MRYFSLSFMVLIPVLSFADEVVRFNRDVRPILSKNCFACHGFDEKAREAELRLDIAENAYGKAESGKVAIVPGKVEESELWKRINLTDPDDIMPPPKHHKPLDNEQKDLLKRWIEQGAKYEGHWAFVKAEMPTLPAGTKDGAAVIDGFVAQTLEAKKMSFSSEADRTTLLRRVTFDLTGLPPTPQEVKAFVDDASPTAYETAVDRLLASPHYGERMALPWLDASRYADTNGFSIDGGRQAWLWRDWVIKAYNDNMPYDQFLTKQLAGDLLPNASESDLIATAFQRNHSITHEGGTIPEENLTNYAADRVKTYGEAVIGLTLGCAQCHDHKYDPITQRDYYQIFAFFNTLDDRGLDGDGGNNAQPAMNAMSPLSTPEEIEKVKAELVAAEQSLVRPREQEMALWETLQRDLLAKRGAGFVTAPCEALASTTPNGSPEQLRIQPDQSVDVHGGAYAAYTTTTKLPTNLAKITGLRIVFEPAPQSKGTIGYGDGSFVMTTVTLSATSFPAGNVDANACLAIARLSASSQQAGFPVSALYSSDTKTGWSPTAGAAPQHLSITFQEPLLVAQTPFITAEMVFNYAGGRNPGKFRILAFDGETDDSTLPEDVTSIVLLDKANRSPEQQVLLEKYFRDFSSDCAVDRYRVANIKDRLTMLTEKHSILIMNTSKKPRKTHILSRGVYSAPMDEVQPNTPAFLTPLNKPNANRLDLAQWSVSRDHPLTARVAVNRLWEIAFGRGLTPSTADFGSQGVWPTHPELLDWMAVRFMEGGWNMKEMMKMIVLSRTYRQSSNTTAEMVKVDPLNEWLARGPRFRLSAEAIRDQALAVSGLMVDRLGGPSVKIYQPGDLWRAVSHYGSTPATSQTFVQDHGEKLYRRSLYTYWKRTLPPTNLATFDAPNREVCTAARTPTNTPLQALVLLNDPQFVEAARHFAVRIIKEGGADDASRLNFGFRAITAREPNEKEKTVLLDALARENKKFAGNADLSKKYLSTGESAIDETLPLEQQATWTAIAQLLLNLSETITRN